VPEPRQLCLRTKQHNLIILAFRLLRPVAQRCRPGHSSSVQLLDRTDRTKLSVNILAIRCAATTKTLLRAWPPWKISQDPRAVTRKCGRNGAARRGAFIWESRSRAYPNGQKGIYAATHRRRTRSRYRVNRLASRRIQSGSAKPGDNGGRGPHRATLFSRRRGSVAPPPSAIPPVLQALASKRRERLTRFLSAPQFRIERSGARRPRRRFVNDNQPRSFPPQFANF